MRLPLHFDHPLMYVPADSEPVTSITELGYKLPVGSAMRRDRNAKASSAICTADEISINKPNTKIDMNKTQKMLNAVNANISKLTNMRYSVERIEDLTSQRAEVIYSHPAMKDDFRHHVVFTRRQAHYADDWIMEMDHESYVESFAETN